MGLCNSLYLEGEKNNKNDTKISETCNGIHMQGFDWHRKHRKEARLGGNLFWFHGALAFSTTNSEQNYTKIKNFCVSKNTINGVKRKPTERENTFAKQYLIRGSYPKWIKKLTMQQHTNWFKSEQRTWIHISPRKIDKRPTIIWQDAQYN